MNARTDVDYRQFISRLSDLARHALSLYGIPGNAGIDLLSHSENTVFKISDPRTPVPTVMRIHRPNYQTRNAIQTELDWMNALNADGIGTPQAVAGLDGACLQDVTLDPVGKRTVALFKWIDGSFPDESNLASSMRRLGRLSARMHVQSKQWQRPAYFERMAWDHQGTIGRAAHWGQWEDAPGLQPDHRSVLQQTEKLLCERLDAFGKTPDRFGLIHADLRVANLLVDGDETHIIDFDDCGLGWFLHDMASALSFIEHRAERYSLMDAWAAGYCEVGSLSALELAEFPTFLMQRRLQLLAWMGSHHETDLARSLGDPWVAATVELGADYLKKMA